MGINRVFFLLSILVLWGPYSCRSRSAYDVKITNGIEVLDEVDVTKPILSISLLKTDGTTEAYCSGTLLNDVTLLTAAHCAPTQDPNTYSLHDKGQVKAVYVAAGFKAADERLEAIIARLKELNTEKPEDKLAFAEVEKSFLPAFVEATQRDLAILVVELEPSFKESIKTFYGISSNPVPHDAVVLVQGYGLTSMDPKKPLLSTTHRVRKKRYGFTQVIQVLDNIIPVISGFKNDADAEAAAFSKGILSSTAQGDSGGPTIDCKEGTVFDESIKLEDCATFRINSVNSRVYLPANAKIDGNDVELNTMASAPLSSDIAKSLFDTAINCGNAHCAKP